MSEPILEVDDISKRFRGVWAVRDVRFTVPPHSIVGIIGPNGSGKTTLLNVCSGVYPPTSGRVRVDGQDVTAQPAHRRAHVGVTRTFQEARVFKTLTCLQNMRVPLIHSSDVGKMEAREQAERLLSLVGLIDKIDTPASELSGGQRKLLEFARAMMTKPRLILMDEPFAGVHPVLKEQMTKSIEAARNQGVTALIVSHELPVLLGLAERVICMAEGNVLFEGPPSQVTSDPRVIEAYLGSGNGDHG